MLQSWLNSKKNCGEKLILESGLFDPVWYSISSQTSFSSLTEYVRHYLLTGSVRGFEPNPLFSPDFYRSRNEDVVQEGCEPFLHYLERGAFEQRDPHPAFSAAYYSKQTGLGEGVNPLQESLLGKKDFSSPHVLFDYSWYQRDPKAHTASSFTSNKSCFSNPLVAYLTDLERYIVAPHPLVHPGFYVGCVGDKSVNPLRHYIEFGYAHRLAPHPLFSGDYYLKMNPDVHQAHALPLEHYLLHGEREGRSPSVFFDVQYYQSRYRPTEGMEGSLVHFVTEGWKLAQSPGPWISMCEALGLGSREQHGDDYPVELFGRMLLEKPNSGICPELYISLKDIETGRVDPQSRYQSLASVHVPEKKSFDELITLPSGLQGLSYYGPFQVESGLGVAARSYLKQLEGQGVVCRTELVESPVYQKVRPWPESTVRDDWPVGLAHVNVDSMYPFLNTETGRRFCRHQYRIGAWVWELSLFPRRWHANALSFDEVWVPSHFCKEAVEAALNIPVKVVPYPIETPAVEGDKEQLRKEFRQKYGIKQDAYVFFYIFDVSSFIQRKNPMALIKAFNRVFSEVPEAHLLLKISYSNQDKKFIRKLQRQLTKLPSGRVTLIDKVLSREELTILMLAGDCYVSPHRSEGFGLTIKESLLLGKDVVATNYGGSTDFLGPHNGFPVEYELVELKKDIGPYPAGAVWAEPVQESLEQGMKEAFHGQVAEYRSAAN